MTEPTSVPLRAVIAIQGELIAEHGALARPPRQVDLEAALARPVKLHACAGTAPTLPRLAAAGELTEEALADWIAAHSVSTRWAQARESR